MVKDRLNEILQVVKCMNCVKYTNITNFLFGQTSEFETSVCDKQNNE